MCSVNSSAAGGEPGRRAEGTKETCRGGADVWGSLTGARTSCHCCCCFDADDLSRQALQAQAEDLAVEDCMLVLDKALLQGKLAPEAYMKQVGSRDRVGGRTRSRRTAALPVVHPRASSASCQPASTDGGAAAAVLCRCACCAGVSSWRAPWASRLRTRSGSSSARQRPAGLLGRPTQPVP